MPVFATIVPYFHTIFLMNVFLGLAFSIHKLYSLHIYVWKHHSGNVGVNGGSDPVPRGAQSVKMQPIAVPAIPVDEIKEITKNFSNETLIGEGSYARVYYAVLKSGEKSAIKKLDSSKQPDQEYLAQV